MDARNIDRYVTPNFMPIVLSSNKHVFCFEALFRFAGQTRLSGSQLRAWENSGYIKNIDMAMIRRVIRDVEDTPLQKRKVAINVSVRTIIDIGDAYIEEIKPLAKITNRLIVEITETWPADKTSTLIDFANKCKALGIAIALDDCAPDNYFWCPDVIREISPGFIKLDGLFLDSCFRKKVTSPIKEIRRIAEAHDAFLVGEHIDSAEKSTFAKNAGITFLQGHHFGAAIPWNTRAEDSTKHFIK